MDKRLRILKRLSLHDPEAMEQYLALLENLVGSKETPSLSEICVDIRNMAERLESVIERDGIEYFDNNMTAAHFLVENDTLSRASGVCLATSTRHVATTIVQHFGFETIETWSVDPEVFMDGGSGSRWSDEPRPYVIFRWSIRKNIIV